MRVACLVSGGKDSIFASYVAASWGWDLAAFVTLLPEDEAPMLFHRPNARWVELQAQAVGVAWRFRRIRADEDEEEALQAALDGLRVDGVTSGALASEYQRTRFERVAHALGLKTFAPLWHHDPARHLRDLMGAGIDSILVHVAAEGLAPAWLGRRLNPAMIDDLAKTAHTSRLNVAGEGGEYESFVLDAPHFRSRVQLDASRVEWTRDTGTMTIEQARLVPKHPVPVHGEN